ncbi:MAG TPA: hypothetical protein VMU83_04940 [Hanamia sp.]|nr:hypothetical protein [Hanamia sp.]
MRKLVLGMTVTADGFVFGPNHEPDWFMCRRDKSVKDRNRSENFSVRFNEGKCC